MQMTTLNSGPCRCLNCQSLVGLDATTSWDPKRHPGSRVYALRPLQPPKPSASCDQNIERVHPGPSTHPPAPAPGPGPLGHPLHPRSPGPGPPLHAPGCPVSSVNHQNTQTASWSSQMLDTNCTLVCVRSSCFDLMDFRVLSKCRFFHSAISWYEGLYRRDMGMLRRVASE